MRKWTLSVIKFSALILVVEGVIACSSPVGSTSNSPSALASSPGNAVWIISPSFADLVGTWYSHTSGSGDWQISSDSVIKIESDGSFERNTNQFSGLYGTTTYWGSRGNISISNHLLMTTEVAWRESMLPFADTESGWTMWSTPLITKNTALLYDGKLFQSSCAYKAEGRSNNLVGTWRSERYVSTYSEPYTMSLMTMQADGAYTIKYYSGISEIFDYNTPSTIYTDTYVDNHDGTLSIGTTIYKFYVNNGCLIMHRPSISGCWIKQ